MKDRTVYEPLDESEIIGIDRIGKRTSALSELLLMWAFCQCSKEHVRPWRMVETPDPCSEPDNQWQIQGFSGDISPKGRSRPSCAPSPPSDTGVIARKFAVEITDDKVLA